MQKENRNPLISIIVPVYGTEAYFDRCIRSLQEQSYKNLEIIVVNDGSKGNISELVQTYLKDPRIRFIDHSENQGLLRARVCGSKEAKGEYIAFVDSDDFVSFDFYRSLLSKAEKTNADITIGPTVWVKGEERFVYNFHESAFYFDLLEGKKIKEAFFGQEYQCYSWHTVWNKLYKRRLWESCLCEFEKIDRHIVMTEDLYFSSLLFYKAERLSRTENDAYFYCSNENASTNAKKISIERFCKNISDIEFVFRKVENFLKKQGADQPILENLKKGQEHYARMWKNLADHSFFEAEAERAEECLKHFCSTLGKQHVKDDYFFESVKTSWKGGLEYIKEKIRDSSQQYISFDVFDTLIKRPFYEPFDLLLLLDASFSKLSSSNVSFSKMRREAEELARKKYSAELGVEDISLDEIYDFLTEHFQIKRSLAEQMKSLECSLERRYCQRRLAGAELFELAKALGKKVILITNMYLDRKILEEILEECGISGYESLFISCQERCLKYNGRLFIRAISKLGISAKDIMHIGDSWISDIEGSKRVHMDAVFFPKAIEVFENKIQGCQTNHCADIGRESCGEHIDYQKTKESLAFRCMQAMAANFYFDNPYRTFHSESDFNADPYFIGFYLLGMHLTGLTRWLDLQLKDSQKENILFLARDGYLPMKAYALFQIYFKEKTKAFYVPASRKALMPIMLKEPVNLYQLPVEYRAHTPLSLCRMLSFMRKEMSEPELHALMEKAGIKREKVFESIEEYHDFINFFLRELYDESKHKEAKQQTEFYYEALPDSSLAFDMGYSGRIQAAICEAAGEKIDVLFLHEDGKISGRMKEASGFKIRSFYGFYPSVSGLMREHIFSDLRGSCIGFEKKGGAVIPILEEESHHYPDRFVIEGMHKGALDFLSVFLENFAEHKRVMDFSGQELSIPFEGFLRRPTKKDMCMFSASYFEDTVFGAKKSINIEAFAMQNLAFLGWVPKTKEKMEREKKEGRSFTKEEEKIIDMVHSSSGWKRGIAWMLMDRNFFKEKLNSNMKRIFRKK